MLTVNEPYPASDDCPYHVPGHHSPECKICQEIDGTALRPRTITIPDAVRERHAQNVMSRPQRLSYNETLIQLTSVPYYGYGPVSARGLLALAEDKGSYTDGCITVTLSDDGNHFFITED